MPDKVRAAERPQPRLPLNPCGDFLGRVALLLVRQHEGDHAALGGHEVRGLAQPCDHHRVGPVGLRRSKHRHDDRTPVVDLQFPAGPQRLARPQEVVARLIDGDAVRLFQVVR
jgi:hypothetical protein